MEENTNLFVFDRKEVFLAFLFFFLTVGISFTLGVRIGHRMSYAQDGYIHEDTQKINLMSVQEEELKQEIREKEEKIETKVVQKKETNFKRLEDEFNRLDQDLTSKKGLKALAEKEVKQVTAPVMDRKPKKVYSIQLGSHSTKNDAIKFADGFRIRGYDPIIKEVHIQGRGIWFRVGLGMFESVAQAKEYIKKEESLFQGQDYVITELK